MYASSRGHHHMPVADWFRWPARVGGAFLLVSWLVLVFAEPLRQGFRLPAATTWLQGVALAIVFAGYLIGWRRELVGGVLAILGTIAFYTAILLTSNVWPGIEPLWFAAPGMLYLLAWHYDQHHHRALRP